MYITITPQGRTGNRLFQYALGIILAKEKQCPLFAPPIPGFNNIKIDQNSSNLNNSDTIHTSTYGTHNYNFDELKNTSKNICIDSYVQKSELLIHYKQLLQEQFKIENTLTCLPKNNELVIHIRETDYTLIDGYLGSNFYTTFIKKYISNYNITIVTDNIHTNLIEELKKLGCNIFTKNACTNWQNPFFTQNEIDDYNYMLYSSNILLSQSTFSWWAAFLGIPKKIIFPYRTTGGMWKLNPKQDDANLYFDFGQSEKYIIE
jgi:hypothetical protein